MDDHLISARKLIVEVLESKRHNPHCGHIESIMHDHEHEAFLRMIFRCPTVDAVEVVRCKDCANRHSSEFCECRPPDAFCSDGERKE